jgi:mRNA-degrading endonuclease toxin of MazEF toxin-antitoxin module
MNVHRGDVVLAVYPFASGTGASRRPALVVQNDLDNSRMENTIIAQITTNLRRAAEPTHLVIEASSPEGQQAGLLHLQ